MHSAASPQTERGVEEAFPLYYCVFESNHQHKEPERNAMQEFMARPGNLWVTGRLSALGLSEETVELPAGGVEGALFVFPAVVDQRSAVLVDHVGDELFRSYLSQRRVFVHVTDDLSAEQPHIVDVALDGSFRQAGLGEVKEEGHEAFDESSPYWKIFVLAHPTFRPLLKIAAIATVWQ